MKGFSSEDIEIEEKRKGILTTGELLPDLEPTLQMSQEVADNLYTWERGRSPERGLDPTFLPEDITSDEPTTQHHELDIDKYMHYGPFKGLTAKEKNYRMPDRVQNISHRDTRTTFELPEDDPRSRGYKPRGIEDDLDIDGGIKTTGELFGEALGKPSGKTDPTSKEYEPTGLEDDLDVGIQGLPDQAKYLLYPIIKPIEMVTDTEPFTEADVGADIDMGKSVGTVRGAARDIGQDIDETIGPHIGGFTAEDAGEEFSLPFYGEGEGKWDFSEAVPLMTELTLDILLGEGVLRGAWHGGKAISRGVGHLVGKYGDEAAQALKYLILDEAGSISLTGKRAAVDTILKKLEPEGLEKMMKARQFFGLTDEPAKAGFIGPDGALLDLSSKRSYRMEVPWNRRTSAHFEVSEAWGGKGTVEELFEYLDKSKSIRLSYHPKHLSLEMSSRPTALQLDAIAGMYRRGAEIYVDLVDLAGKRIASEIFDDIADFEKFIRRNRSKLSGVGGVTPLQKVREVVEKTLTEETGTWKFWKNKKSVAATKVKDEVKRAVRKGTLPDVDSAKDFVVVGIPADSDYVKYLSKQLEKSDQLDLLDEFTIPIAKMRISHDELARVAKALDIDPEDLAKLDTAGMLFSPTLRKYRKHLADEATTLVQKARVASTEIATPVNKDELIKQLRDTLTFHRQVRRLESDTGRALESLKMPYSDDTVINKTINILGEVLDGKRKFDIDRLANQIAHAASQGGDALDDLIRHYSRSGIEEWSGKLYEYWISSILSGVRTQVRNIMGTATSSALKYPERLVAGALDPVISAIKGTPRQRYMMEAASALKGTFAPSNFKAAFSRMGKSLKQGSARYSKYEMPHENGFKESLGPFIRGKIRGRAIRAPLDLLNAIDDFFKQLVRGGEIRALAYRDARFIGRKGDDMLKHMDNIISNPPEHMLEALKEEELYRTFQRGYGKWGKKLAEARKLPGGRWVVAFMRTPINVTKMGLEYTPLNLLRLGGKGLAKKLGVTGKGAAATSKHLASKQAAELADSLARGLIGTGGMTALALAASSGTLTGSGPEDRTERYALMKTGWRPYSIKVGDNYYSYKALEPLAIPIGLVADAVEISENWGDKELYEHVGKLANTFNELVLDQSFLFGLVNFIEMLDDPLRYFPKWLSHFTSGFTPMSGMLSQVQKEVDPSYKDVSPTQYPFTRIPGLGSTYPKKRDIWGDPIGDEDVLPFTPIRKSPISKDKVHHEMVNSGARVGRPSRSFTIGNEKVKLSSGQYSEYVRLSGQEAYRILSQKVNSPGWDEISKERRKEVVEKVFGRARRKVRKSLKRQMKGQSASGRGYGPPHNELLDLIYGQ